MEPNYYCTIHNYVGFVRCARCELMIQRGSQLNKPEDPDVKMLELIAGRLDDLNAKVLGLMEHLGFKVSKK